jgi:hypothetical protein
MSEWLGGEAPTVAEVVVPSNRRSHRIAAVAGLGVVVLGVIAVLVAGYLNQSHAVNGLKHDRTRLTSENAALSGKLTAAKSSSQKATAALAAISRQLAKTKNELATAKKQAAAATVSAYSNGFSTGNSNGYAQGANDASGSGYNSGYTDGYSAGYNVGLCIDPTNGAYVC